MTITFELEGHKNTVFLHFHLLLFLLFCKLQCLFTSYESGQGSGFRSKNCAANAVEWKRERENIVLQPASLCDFISMWFNFCTRTLICRKLTQKLFSSYCMTGRQTDTWYAEEHSLNVHYQPTWQNLRTHPFMKELPVLC